MRRRSLRVLLGTLATVSGLIPDPALALPQKTFTTRTLWDRLPVKFSGPLFIVYPYDSRPELKDLVYRNRSAWQLKEIAFE